MPSANANPTKRFFVDMLIRDATLEDTVLDLVDNCIDGYSRKFNIKLSAALLEDGNHHGHEMRFISITYGRDHFTIEDNCGGIDFEDAERDIFRMGRSEAHSHSGLSVFGIGLKRAMFKIGKKVEMTSRSENSGFRMSVDVDQWVKDDQLNDGRLNWHFPLERLDPAKDADTTGTRLVIKELRPEICAVLSDGSLEKRISDSISTAYPFFLERHLKIKLNGTAIEGKNLAFSQSDNLIPGIESWHDDGVLVELFCGVRPKDDPIRGFWKQESAGWYLVCNGRVVVQAEKTNLTGWGISGELPQFQPKHRGFLGIVFFSSENPEALPWKTTKQGINSESLVYIHTRPKMVSHGKKVISLLDSMYQSNDSTEENPAFRGLTNTAQPKSIKAYAEEAKKMDGQARPFDFNKPLKSEEITTTRVQYDAPKKDLDKVRTRLKRRSMSATDVGKYTFNYFLERECKE